MKNTGIVGFLALGVTVISFNAFAETPASLGETLGWLQSTIRDRAVTDAYDYRSEPVTRVHEETTMSYGLSDCVVNISKTVTATVGGAQSSTRYDYRLPLAELDSNLPALMTSSSEGTDALVTITGKAGRSVIRKGQGDWVSKMVVSFPFSDFKLAQQVRRGFAHAITLCQSGTPYFPEALNRSQEESRDAKLVALLEPAPAKNSRPAWNQQSVQ